MAHGDASFSAQVRFQQRLIVEIIKTSIVQLIAQFIEQFSTDCSKLEPMVYSWISRQTFALQSDNGHDCASIDWSGEARFILERGLAGFPQFGKKYRIRFTLPRQMGRKKNRPKDKYYFFDMKYSKTSLTTTLIWPPLYKLTLNFHSLLLSPLPFSSSFESLFHQTNIRDYAVIRAQAFSVAQNVPKWRQSVWRVRSM